MRNNDAERISASARPTDSVWHPDHAHSNDGVHTHGEAHRYNNRYQGDILFAHTDRVGTNTKNDETARDQYPRTLTQSCNRTMQCRVDRSALSQDRNDAADEKDQEDNVLRRLQALRNCDQEMPGSYRDFVFGTQAVIGPADHHGPVRILRIRLALELAVWNDVR